MALTVIGVFDNATEAQEAVEQLVNDGFSRSNIDLSAQTGTYTDEVTYSDDDKKESGIGGFFSSLFGSDDDDARKHTTVAERGTIVTVHTQTNDEAERAADILDDNGAVDVNERAAEYGYSSTAAGLTDTAALNTNTDRTVAGIYDKEYTSPANLSDDVDQTLKVVREDLQVGKREVETGGVRVRSRIVERPVEESLRLREERVHIQRTPVNRPASVDDLNAFQDGQIEVVEHAEVPVVSKTANVVEEISVGKEVNERTETVRDTVRNTEVDVEELNSTDPSYRKGRTDYDDELTTSTNR